MESTIRPNEQSVVSRLSDDLSATDDSHCVETSLMNKTEIVSAKELKIMVLKWKSSCMLFFSNFGRKTLHGFLSWCVWFGTNINKQILERYRVTVNKKLTKKRKYIMNYVQSFRS